VPVYVPGPKPAGAADTESVDGAVPFAADQLNQSTLVVELELAPVRDGKSIGTVKQVLKGKMEAKTLTFDSKTNHVLLIGAETAPPPEPPAGTPPAAPGGRGGFGGRGQMVPGSFTILVVGK